MPPSPAPQTIDEYIAGFPADVQVRLRQIRQAAREAAPQAEESLKYHMPTLSQNGVLIHFAAYKQHIGVFPPPRGTEAFRKKLAVYAGPKGALKFPLDEPLPLDLISRMVKYKLKENQVNTRVKARAGKTRK